MRHLRLLSLDGADLVEDSLEKSCETTVDRCVILVVEAFKQSCMGGSPCRGKNSSRSPSEIRASGMARLAICSRGAGLGGRSSVMGSMNLLVFKEAALSSSRRRRSRTQGMVVQDSAMRGTGSPGRRLMDGA